MKKTIKIIFSVIIVAMFILNICTSVYFLTYNDTETIFNDNILKVVEIKVTNDEETWGYATGFFVDDSGTILTNKHVVYNTNSSEYYSIIKVRLADDEEWYDATILNVSEDSDLAKIKIEKSNTKYFEIESDLSNGESIYTIGNPNGFGLSFTSGLVSSNLRNVVYNGETIQTVQTNFVINEGNSGGPVFNKKGKLVGIISFRLTDKNGDVIQGVSFALTAETISNFLNL